MAASAITLSLPPSIVTFCKTSRQLNKCTCGDQDSLHYCHMFESRYKLLICMILRDCAIACGSAKEKACNVGEMLIKGVELEPILKSCGSNPDIVGGNRGTLPPQLI